MTDTLRIGLGLALNIAFWAVMVGAVCLLGVYAVGLVFPSASSKWKLRRRARRGG